MEDGSEDYVQPDDSEFERSQEEIDALIAGMSYPNEKLLAKEHDYYQKGNGE